MSATTHLDQCQILRKLDDGCLFIGIYKDDYQKQKSDQRSFYNFMQFALIQGYFKFTINNQHLLEHFHKIVDTI